MPKTQIDFFFLLIMNCDTKYENKVGKLSKSLKTNSLWTHKRQIQGLYVSCGTGK